MKATTKCTNLDQGASLLHQGEPILVEAQAKREPTPEELQLDFTIRVDRSVKSTYPEWIRKLGHPELECSGPAEYNLESDVEERLYDIQKVGGIYKCLKEDGALATCLNLQDGLAIQQKGIAVFRKLFGWKAVFLWASVAEGCAGDMVVPHLYEYGERVKEGWRPLDYTWTDRDCVPQFRK